MELTIDYDVQRATEEAFRKLGYNGAAVVLDPRNGEVLSYVSLPAYDPNEFAARGTGVRRHVGVAQHRQAQAPPEPRHPGPVLARVHLQDGGDDGGAPGGGRDEGLQGQLRGQRDVLRPPVPVLEPEGRGHGHGTLDMEHGLENSCNVYFYTLGNLVGIDKISKWAKLLGLGEKSGIDLPNEVQGIIPSPEWKKATTGEKWYSGETISVSIGQGQVTVTPVSMAVYVSTIANGGTRYVPHLVRRVDEGKGWQAGARARAAVEGGVQARDDRGAARGPVAGGERRRHRRQREDRRARTCRARPAPRR